MKVVHDDYVFTLAKPAFRCVHVDKRVIKPAKLMIKQTTKITIIAEKKNSIKEQVER